MDWIQIHLALNHVPVVGTPILVLLLAVGSWRRNGDMIRVALWSIALLAVASIAIKFTGDFALEQSPKQFAAVKDLVSRHEQAGDQVTTAVFVLGLAAGLGLFLARWKRRIRPWSIALVLLFGILTSLLYVRSAHTGGQISHPELRGVLRTIQSGYSLSSRQILFNDTVVDDGEDATVRRLLARRVKYRATGWVPAADRSRNGRRAPAGEGSEWHSVARRPCDARQSRDT